MVDELDCAMHLCISLVLHLLTLLATMFPETWSISDPVCKYSTALLDMLVIL